MTHYHAVIIGKESRLSDNTLILSDRRKRSMYNALTTMLGIIWSSPFFFVPSSIFLYFHVSKCGTTDRPCPVNSLKSRHTCNSMRP
jgi:hypothetical protein